MTEKLVTRGRFAGTHAEYVDQVPGTPQQGVDTAGEDTYATVVTTTSEKRHIMIKVDTNPAIISIDGGTTDNIYVPENSIVTLDWCGIANAVAIQAKNANAGSNYANLVVNVW